MANTCKIDLEFPVTVTIGKGADAREEIIDTIELRRPKVKDVKDLNLQNLEGDDLVLLIMRLADLDRAIISEFDLVDFLNMTEVIGGFFPTPSEDKKAAA